jgi:hypothetical protein
MARLISYLGQAVVYAALAAATGVFASQPVYQQFPQGKAQIKLSFAHGAARQQECRRLTSQEIAKLPRNERRPNTCARERVPIHVQLQVDKRTLLDERLAPTGLAADGPARIYRKFAVPAGKHVIVARLRDSRGEGPFDYETRRAVTLATGQNLAIDFKSDAGGFIFE